MKFYWRRISFSELKEYAAAPGKTRATLCLFSTSATSMPRLKKTVRWQSSTRQLCHRARIRIQARVLSHLDGEEHKKALGVIRGGIVEIEDYLRRTGRFDQLGGMSRSCIFCANGKRK